jgi:hypothetical protein
MSIAASLVDLLLLREIWSFKRIVYNGQSELVKRETRFIFSYADITLHCAFISNV